MITEQTVIGKLEILEDGLLQIREDTIISRNGVVLTRLYHRRTLEPGVDTTAEHPRIRAVVGAVWTPEVIAEYRRNRPDPIRGGFR